MEPTHKFSIKKEHYFRRMMQDALWLGRKKDVVYTLLDVNVSTARRVLQERRRNEKTTMSLTAYITWCVAYTAKEFPLMFCKRSGSHALAMYDDVDVVVPLSFSTDSGKILVSKILRSANRCTFAELNEQIETARKMAPPYLSRVERLFLQMPDSIRRIFYRWWSLSPKRFKMKFGNILVSSFGMFASGRLYGIGRPYHTTGVFIGSTFESELELDDRSITITIATDHGIVDGEYLVRFSNHLKKCIEEGVLS